MPILESPEIEDLCKSYLDLISALYKLFNDYSDRLLAAHNISVGSELLKITWDANKEMVELRDNLTDADPLFVDPPTKTFGGDFRLKDDSPAWQLGFKAIPFEKIGCKGSEN